MNLINRDLLASNLRAYRRTASQHNSLIYLSKAYDGFISEVTRMPTVEAEPVRHGHWIKHPWAEIIEEHLIDKYECSECHHWQVNDSNYCPNCGAKMDEEMKEE